MARAGSLRPRRREQSANFHVPTFPDCMIATPSPSQRLHSSKSEALTAIVKERQSSLRGTPSAGRKAAPVFKRAPQHAFHLVERRIAVETEGVEAGVTLRISVTVVAQTLQLELERGDAGGGEAIRRGDECKEAALVCRRKTGNCGPEVAAQAQECQYSRRSEWRRCFLEVRLTRSRALSAKSHRRWSRPAALRCRVPLATLG